MNRRQKELLKIFALSKDQIFRVQQLAAQLDCGEKTVRNDLDKVKHYLQKFPSAKLIRTPGVGISLQLNEEDRLTILQEMLAKREDVKTDEEIKVEIAYQLLSTNKPLTLQQLADRYYVPKARIKHDLDAIALWLEKYELEMISKPRLGHVIQGTELNKRNALARLYELNATHISNDNYVLNLFIPYEREAVKRALQQMADQFSLNFLAGTFENLLVHALIMIKRTLQKSPVNVPIEEKQAAMKLPEYKYVDFLFQRLETIFRIRFPEDERIYFTWHLASSKLQSNQPTNSLVYTDVIESVHELIGKMEQLTLMNFRADAVLMSSLTIHLHAVFNRLKYGFPISNPLLSDIKKMYPYIFNMVVLAVNETKGMKNLPEDEVAYIVLHFQAAIERRSGKYAKKKAVIVCHLGIGMSHLLEAKIKQHFYEIDCLACVSKDELLTVIDQLKPDFIISTVSLERSPVKHIVISPLFNQSDKKKLNDFIEKMDAEQNEYTDFHAVVPYLKKELFSRIKNHHHRFEVVEALGKRLVAEGLAKQEFIHDAVKREKKSATAIGGGIAIPHGNPELIVETSIAVAIMDEPMEWGAEWVSVVFLLAFSKQDPEVMKKVMSAMAKLSESPDFVQQLKRAEDFDAFVDLLKG
ncbi:BglG family transcription antiterminator [Fervidibacillus albus]|uniref:BglG family transcription antiterminator n=1 Tax=Fervidibacillus albus TaxID=2980026 RepID=A0A9E8RVG3_9BACI|nr:BglG family transcription antiterminator [Fervidibacillus albus]WAA08898.1 BglG family transcription antiterminator [Fervidibacillus albus]